MDEMSFPDRPFTTAEILKTGLARWELDRALEQGLLRRVVRGVMVRRDLEDNLELRARAVDLVVSDDHVVVDRSAAWLHGVDTLTLAEQETLPPIETAASKGGNRTERAEVIGRNRDLAETDVMTVFGVRVTTPLRTALDLGCHLRRREAFAAMNQLARLHGITSEALIGELPRFRGRRGVRQLKELVRRVDPRVESQRESWTLLAILDTGLPAPEPQFWIVIDGVPTYRLDFAWPALKVAVEYDGIAFHLLTEEQRRHDRERRAYLSREGWTIIVVRNGQFRGPGLDRWIDELRGALRSGYSPLRFRPTR